MTIFPQALNNFSTVLAADHTVGSNRLLLPNGVVGQLGTVLPTQPVWLTVIRRDALVQGRIADNRFMTIFRATGIDNGELVIDAVLEGTVDQIFYVGDLVTINDTAGLFELIFAAINALESEVASGVAVAIGAGVGGGAAGRVLFEAAGPVVADSANLTYSGGTLMVTAPDETTNPLSVRIVTGQTQDSLRILDGDGNVLSRFGPKGALGFNFGTNGIAASHFITVFPNDTYNGNFLFSLATFANNGADPQPDVVLAIGYNTDGTTLNDPTKPGCSTNLESYYNPSGTIGGTPQFEYHAAQVHFVDGTIWRPWSVSIPYDKSAIAHAVRASSISWEAPDGTQQILTTWPTIELKNSTAFLQNVNNLAWLNQRATDGSSNISLAMVDGTDRTVFGQVGRAAYIPGSSVTIDNPLYAGSNVGVGTLAPNVSGQAGNVRVITVSGTDTGGFGGFEANTTSPSVDALVGYFGFTASSLNAGYRLPAFIGAWLEGSTANKLGASLRFHTQPDNTAGPLERFRVTSTGQFLVNQTASGSASAQFEITPASASTVGQAIYLAPSQTEDALRVVNSSGTMLIKIDASGRHFIGTDANLVYPTLANVVGAPSVDNGARELLTLHDTSAMAAGVGGGICFGGRFDTGGDFATFANVQGTKVDGTSGNWGGQLEFYVRQSPTGGMARQLVIDDTTATFAGILQLGTFTGTPFSSAEKINLGAGYGNNTPGSTGNLKLLTYDDTNPYFQYGIGVSAHLFEFTTSVDASFGWYRNGATPLELMYLSNSGVLNVTGGLTIPLTTTNAITVGITGGSATAGLAGYSVSLGATYGTGTPGSNDNMKLWLFDYSDPHENYGFGLSSALMEITCGSLADIGFFKNGTTPAELLRIKNNGNLSVKGTVATPGVVLSRKTITTTTTLVSTDNSFVAITSTGSAYTVTLPAANAVPAGFTFTFKDEGGGATANNITISPAGSDTTETALALSTNYQVLRVYSDGVSKWFLL